MYQRILVALDGSEIAQGALEFALHLAKSEMAELRPIYVIEYPSAYYSAALYDFTPFHDEMVTEAKKILGGAEAQMAKAGVPGKTRIIDTGMLSEPIAQQIQAAAEEADVDLVVLGTHGRRGLQRLMLGSVAESFVRLATRPVALVPHKAARSQEGQARLATASA